MVEEFNHTNLTNQKVSQFYLVIGWILSNDNNYENIIFIT